MHLNNLLASLAGRPGVALIVLGLTALFIGIKVLVTAIQRAWRENATGLTVRLQELESAVDELRAAPVQKGRDPAHRSALHGDNRIRAIAMIEAGETIASVSATLGAPPSEVELLTKVHRFLARQSA